MDEDVQVELDAADHEEDRDEESEPMASNLARIPSLSEPAENRRTTMPAAKAPSRTSRPRVSASSTSSTMNSSDTRTGSCALDSRWRLRRETNRGGWVLAANRTVITATAMKRQQQGGEQGFLLGEQQGTATIGPNSPTVPMAEMMAPNPWTSRPHPATWGPGCRGPWW